MQKLCVIGSLNIDLCMTLPRFHEPGETLSGTGFSTHFGGKGGNQAVALGRLGASVAMAGCLGEDEYAMQYRRHLRVQGVDDSLVQTCSGPTGVALIEIDQSSGDNRIALFSGANNALTPARVQTLLPRLETFDFFLLQLEIPFETTEYLIDQLHTMGKIIMLDPAPAVPLAEALLAKLTIITPNQTELAILTDMPTQTVEQAMAAAHKLHKSGPIVLAKLGADGALVVSQDVCLHVPAFNVRVLDTTAAGDSFNAGFAFSRSRGTGVKEAIRFANATGALATTAVGAQSAMPTLEEVELLCKQR